MVSWGWWRGDKTHPESGFLFFFCQICPELTFIQNFIKIKWKKQKLAYWGGLGGWGWFLGGCGGWIYKYLSLAVGFAEVTHQKKFQPTSIFRLENIVLSNMACFSGNQSQSAKVAICPKRFRRMPRLLGSSKVCILVISYSVLFVNGIGVKKKEIAQMNL